LLSLDSARRIYDGLKEKKLLERKKELSRRQSREKTDRNKEENERKILR
jgi:hypothetical protein